MAELRVDCPDAQLAEELEFALRDQAHDLVGAHQTGLEDRKKAATKVAASPAPTVARLPSSSTI
jgi:hypothetical protein